MRAMPRGFTLLEAVTCLAILGLLAGIAVPTWTGVRVRAHAASARSELMATLTSAITHAARTGTEVVLCPAQGDACLDQWDWSGGWIAFADVDGSRSKGTAETMVRVVRPLKGGVRLVTTTGRRRLVMQPNGGNHGSNVTFTLCARGGGYDAEVLVLSNTGQLRDAPASKAKARACEDG